MKEGIQRKLDETDVYEVWYTDNVPTGYAWADHDADVKPRGSGSPHGTHVSDKVAANGDEPNGGIEGIAPITQLLVEKFFQIK